MVNQLLCCRAARYIACDSHAYLFSEDGSVISRKFASQATQYHVHYRMRCICDSERELCSLSVNYGSVY